MALFDMHISYLHKPNFNDFLPSSSPAVLPQREKKRTIYQGLLNLLKCRESSLEDTEKKRVNFYFLFKFRKNMTPVKVKQIKSKASLFSEIFSSHLEKFRQSLEILENDGFLLDLVIIILCLIKISV